MLQGILDFFTALLEPILVLFDLVISFVQDIVYIITLLGGFALTLPRLLDFLPSACVLLLVGVFSVVIIYKILGRE